MFLKIHKTFNTNRIFKRLAKALISLRVCAGWSETLLVVHTTLLETSCRGSYLPGSASMHVGHVFEVMYL